MAPELVVTGRKNCRWESGVSNPHRAKFCNECGNKLVWAETDKTKKSHRMSLDKSIVTIGRQLQKKRQADIMFVLDCTGSMQGEIDAIKETIMDFADTIESEGVRVRVGLVEFRDRLKNLRTSRSSVRRETFYQ